MKAIGDHFGIHYYSVSKIIDADKDSQFKTCPPIDPLAASPDPQLTAIDRNSRPDPQAHTGTQAMDPQAHLTPRHTS
jgi:hypothetical protein